MKENKEYLLPVPIVNEKEEITFDSLNERYNKLVEPSILAKTGAKIIDAVPESVKKMGESVKQPIKDAELFVQCMKVVAEGFTIIEKKAAALTISEKTIIKKINKTLEGNEIKELREICLARSYDISKLVSKYKTQDLGLAFIEGGATGYFGFAGLPFNLVLSLFLYYRAVQSIAMFYGYDVKKDSAELVIASEVFMNAINPDNNEIDEMSSIIGKVMLMTEITAIKQTSAKTWADMAARGGMGLLLTQMRALANKAAKEALEKVGEKGLENSLFRGVFEQIGRKLTKKAVGKAMPVAGAVIGALFDTAQMNTILEYADVFYNKRFLAEKEARISMLFDGKENDVIIEEVIESSVVED